MAVAKPIYLREVFVPRNDDDLPMQRNASNKQLGQRFIEQIKIELGGEIQYGTLVQQTCNHFHFETQTFYKHSLSNQLMNLVYFRIGEIARQCGSPLQTKFMYNKHDNEEPQIGIVSGRYAAVQYVALRSTAKIFNPSYIETSKAEFLQLKVDGETFHQRLLDKEGPFVPLLKHETKESDDSEDDCCNIL